MAVSFSDLPALHKPYKAEIADVLEQALTHGEFVLGSALGNFERNFAREIGTSAAVGVASGTDALLLSLYAIGVAAGDEVICPALGSMAMAEAIVRSGASIVFVDVGQDMTIDTEAVRAAISEKTKVILAAHTFGLAADVVELSQIAADYGIYLIEDVTQAAGASVDGRNLGTYGISGAFSFYPTSTLGCLGDGGMIVTDSEEMAQRVRLYRNHGQTPDQEYVYSVIGFCSRLDSLQAAFLDLKLESLREDNADRVANASYYDAHIPKEFFTLPEYREDGSHVYSQYTIQHPARDEVRNFLSERQIDTRVYHPVPLHLQPALEYLGYRPGHFPVSETLSENSLSLPIQPGLSRRCLDEVAHTLDLYAKTHPVAAATT